MRISINTASFSFRFIGIWLLAIAAVAGLSSLEVLAVISGLFGLLMILQRNRHIIPKNSDRVADQVAKTLEMLGLVFERNGRTFLTKTTRIQVRNFGLFSMLHFKFDQVYNTQGRYLAQTIVKYQRYN